MTWETICSRKSILFGSVPFSKGIEIICELVSNSIFRNCNLEGFLPFPISLFDVDIPNLDITLNLEASSQCLRSCYYLQLQRRPISSPLALSLLRNGGTQKHANDGWVYGRDDVVHGNM